MLQLANFGLEYVKAWRTDSGFRDGSTGQLPVEGKNIYKIPFWCAVTEHSENGRAGMTEG